MQEKPTTRSLQLVGVNVDALQRDIIEVQLPDAASLQVRRRNVTVRGASDLTWVGDVPFVGGQATLAVQNGEMTGTIRSGYDGSVISLIQVNPLTA